MTFLIADGVVPSNEDRGYILRRVMRRAIQQGRSLGIEPGFLPRFADVVDRVMGAAYPELRRAERDVDRQVAEAEEEGFGRTLEQGTKLLDELIERASARRARSPRRGRVPPARHVRLPVRPDARDRAEQGLGVDDRGLRRR